ncbi:hypothetical protein ABZ442_05850 [Streptomyces triculaminicus]|uniref:hypothetical protein n=1 Tax=Streptomyces triculaminicus TaxID=2816232 RepID=UPI0033E9361E
MSSTAPRSIPTAGLGPLEKVDGHWVIGEPGQKMHVVFKPEGLEAHKDDQEPWLTPWWRFMGLGVEVTSHRFTSSRLFGLSHHGPMTLQGPRLVGTVRKPYEMWSAQFSRHRHAYPFQQIVLLQQLLGWSTETGMAERLGDPAWMDSAVARLAAVRLHGYRERRTREAVETALADISGAQQ